MMKSIVAIATVVLLSAPVAMAKPAFGVCAADIKAKCAGVQPGEGRIVACVKTNAAGFSEPCKARLARVAAISKACAPDIKQHCAGMERRLGVVRACIKKVIGNVSDQCKEAFAQTVAGKN